MQENDLGVNYLNMVFAYRVEAQFQQTRITLFSADGAIFADRPLFILGGIAFLPYRCRQILRLRSATICRLTLVRRGFMRSGGRQGRVDRSEWEEGKVDKLRLCYVAILVEIPARPVVCEGGKRPRRGMA